MAASLILLFHPYRGIWHDSVVYLGQSLALLHPDTFRHDLFFAYGSQADYTVFPRVVAWLIEFNGSGRVFLWLTLAGLGAFVLASWHLLRTLLPESARLPGLLALILLPASYGAWGILSYAEPFLTGRSFAEPLALVGLAALLRGRHWLAALSWAAAISLHPLQAPAIAVIAWLWLALEDRRWLHLAWIAPIGLIACLAVPQMQFLTARMDPAWHQQVWQRSLVVFYTHSGPTDWNYLLKDLFVAGVAANHARGLLRRYLLAVLGATVLLFIAGLVLSDLLHLAWPAALQLWRVHWILHWSATAVLPWLCIRLWRNDPAGWPRMLVFLSAVVLGLIPGAAHPAMPAMALLYLAWPRLSLHVSPALQKALAAIAGGIALAYLYAELHALIPWLPALHHERWVDSVQQPRVPAAIALVAALIAARAWSRLPDRGRGLGVVLMGLLLAHSALQWDQRSDLQRAFTQPVQGENPFGVDIRPEEQVIWLGNLLPAWSVLQRPYYIHQQQLSGIVFNRETSMEGFRRRDLMHVVDGAGKDCRIVVFPKEDYASCKPDDDAVRHACARARGKLAYFVLYYPLQAQARGTWTPGDGTSGTYYLYACRDFTERTPVAAVAAAS